ncbi:MAG: zinc dependent phospholipase C family protein [Oscillospiraceae bacterium]|nr:zinc dependent phospholipase C family protein [Oscillospiraceae bacterium]
MRGKSHQLLGRYLADRYMSTLPKRYVKAFLIGCIEPDRNPATYLKGSLHQQWLRGHNWGNSRKYMQRTYRKLEHRKKLKLLDYYLLGRLIHYTTDAFTSAHNEEFGSSLVDHREYEVALQDHFLEYLSENPEFWTDAKRPVMDTIQSYHRDYIRRPASIHTDTRFAIIVCCMVLTRLFAH